MNKELKQNEMAQVDLGDSSNSQYSRGCQETSEKKGFVAWMRRVWNCLLRLFGKGA